MRTRDRMADATRSKVWSAGTGGAQRKWFGRCEVGGCGDGFCAAGEDFKSCPKDCTCGNGVCGAGEDARNFPQDCSCGNGTCDVGESSNNCPQDCGGCGDGFCGPGESCSTCAEDCGGCAETTCAGNKPTAEAATTSGALRGRERVRVLDRGLRQLPEGGRRVRHGGRRPGGDVADADHDDVQHRSDLRVRRDHVGGVLVGERQAVRGGGRLHALRPVPALIGAPNAGGARAGLHLALFGAPGVAAVRSNAPFASPLGMRPHVSPPEAASGG